MKRKIAVILALLTGLMFFGCRTVPKPITPANPFPVGVEYEVLGRVILDEPKLANGYIKLFEKAKAEYPDCDDVVNIWVESAWNGRHYALSGLAIKYIK